VCLFSLAHRIAAEQNTSIDELVGYAVRFDEKHASNTRIKYLTDGMIVRGLLSDPTLSKYGVNIVDEVHERTLRTDLLLANLKSIQKQRNPLPDLKRNAGGPNSLKIIIMSATWMRSSANSSTSMTPFASHHRGYLTIFKCKLLYIKGRQHPVKI